MDNIIKRWKAIPITVKVSFAYVVCSILQQGLSFITLPIFTRLLTKEQYGLYTVYQSWAGILSIILTLNLAYGSFSKAMVQFENDRDGYISSVEGICGALAFLFLIVYLPFQSLWNKLFELPTGFICLMVAELLGNTAILLWSGKKRFEFRYKSVVAVTLLKSVSSPLLAYILVVNSDEKGYARILGYALVNIAIGWFFYIRNAIRGKKLLHKDYWSYALRFNIPLLVYYFSQVIFNQSDRIMISHLDGTDKAAVYGVAYSFAMVLTFVLNAINNSYVPWFYGKLKDGRQEENRSVSVIIAGIMALLLSGVIWFAPEIISIMAGEKYMEAIYVVPPVAISLLLLFYSQLFINVEFFYEEKKKLVWASIGSAIANLFLNWIFIREFGYIAAGYTTLISYMLFAFANYLAMKHVLHRQKIEDNAYSYKELIFIFLFFCILSVIGAYLYNYLPVRIFCTLAVLVIIFFHRNLFLTSYSKFKEKQSS